MLDSTKCTRGCNHCCMTIKESYNQWASQYDSNINLTRDLDQKATKAVLDHYPYTSVLELGCGTGKNTSYHLEKADQIVGLDFSVEMLSKAKEKVQDKHVKFLHADLNNDWLVADESFNLITCSLTLEHIANLNYIFQQAHQKLKRKGYFFMCELHPFKQYQGSKARFDVENGNTITLETYTHHISDYLNAASTQGFQLLELKEWFDELTVNEIPRLISFVFQK